MPCLIWDHILYMSTWLSPGIYLWLGLCCVVLHRNLDGAGSQILCRATAFLIKEMFTTIYIGIGDNVSQFYAKWGYLTAQWLYVGKICYWMHLIVLILLIGLQVNLGELNKIDLLLQNHWNISIGNSVGRTLLQFCFLMFQLANLFKVNSS